MSDYRENRGWTEDDDWVLPREAFSEEQDEEATLRLPPEEFESEAHADAPKRPVLQAMGFLDQDKCKGQWTLDWDDTLHYRGGDLLVTNGGADRFCSKVRRIVIDGFWYIGPGIFEGFRECEELVLSRPYVQIDREAFAHCSKLRTVTCGEIDAEPDAFRDTPYQAALDGAEYVPEQEAAGNTPYAIASGEWGRRFLQETHRETERMLTMKSQDMHERWAYDRRNWFEDSILLIGRGAEAGEPAMLYLAAELLEFANPSYYYVYSSPEDAAAFRDKSSKEYYLNAALKGFPLAILWCAFCLADGRCGFSRDPDRARALLRILKESDNVPQTLALRELRFLADDCAKITEAAYDADLGEDEAGDLYYSQKAISEEEYHRINPNPMWSTLHLRNIDLVTFMISIGLPFILSDVGYDYHWPSEFQALTERVKEAKTAWLAWCVVQGLDVTLD